MKTTIFLHVLLIFTIMIVGQPHLFSQYYLPKEKEKEIKISGKYYWGEGSGLNEDIARQNALVDLTNQVIISKLLQSEEAKGLLESLEIKAQISYLEQTGKFKIIAWLLKDSTLVTNKAPIEINSQNSVSELMDNSITNVQSLYDSTKHEKCIFSDIQENNSIKNSTIEELVGCKTYDQVMQIARTHGLVVGRNSSKGFVYPEQCIIAVFTKGGQLTTLLDKGVNMRKDLLSGNEIQNPEYTNKGDENYNLLWIQVK